MATLVNIRHGRIKLKDGNTTAPAQLVKTVTFEDGDFEYSTTKNVEDILDRDVLVGFRRGSDEPLTWSFSAMLKDKTLRETIDEYVWDGTTQLITGLVANSLNNNVATTYGFKQGTFSITDAGFTKLATGVAPTVAGQYSEQVGVADIEGVLVATAIDVFMPAADTDINTTYGAIGKSTLADTACDADVKTLKICLEKLNPCDLTQVLVTYELDHSTQTGISQSEGTPTDKESFSGKSMIIRPLII